MIDRINEWNYYLGEALNRHLETGSFLAVAVVFAAGVLTSFTPCVYPVIPITVSYIGGAAAGSRRRAVAMSATYVGGLAFVYAGLGVVAALLGKTFGVSSQSGWVSLVVGLVIVFFGLAMFDVVTIQMPSFLTGVQGEGARRGGYLGALLMGVAAAFVTAPCTAPVLGVLLSLVGQSRDIVRGSLLMLVFALGLGLLLMILGIFSGTLTSLPKPGKWMNWVKYAFGSAMLLLGAWYLFQAGRAFLA